LRKFQLFESLVETAHLAQKLPETQQPRTYAHSIQLRRVVCSSMRIAYAASAEPISFPTAAPNASATPAEKVESRNTVQRRSVLTF
jgi:hypothetical protein